MICCSIGHLCVSNLPRRVCSYSSIRAVALQPILRFDLYNRISASTMRIFLVVLVVLNAVWSQSPSSAPSIAGVVMDSSNASVAGATVTLRRTSDAAQRVATVEATGTFRFDGVAPGDYEVEIRHVGFQPSVSRIRVGSRSPPPRRIVLAVAELRQRVTVGSHTDQV